MLFGVICLIFLASVQAIEYSPFEECGFKLYLEEPQSLTPDGQDPAKFVGNLVEVSAAAIENLLNDIGIQTKLRDDFKSETKLSLRAKCLMPSGWGSIHLTTSDEQALMPVFTYSAAPKPDNARVNLMNAAIYFQYPKDFSSWFINITMSAHTVSAAPRTILIQDSTLTFFPKTELILTPIKSTKPGVHLPDNLLEQSICIFELDAHTPWPVSTLKQGKLLRLLTPTPVTQDSEWKLLHRYERTSMSTTANLDFNYGVTRFYAKNEPWLRYLFGPFVDGNRTHRVAFVSGPEINES